MKLFYISNTGIPSRTASSFHVTKMFQAFAQEGICANLVVPRIDNRSVLRKTDFMQHYGVNLFPEIRYIRATRALRRQDYSVRSALLAKKNGADLVYSRNIAAAVWSSTLGIPTIYESHGLPNSRASQRYFKILTICYAFRYVVVISEALKKLFLKKYGGRLPRNKIVVAHDGVDIERFENLPQPSEAKHKVGLNRKRLVVGYAGHLYEGRGIKLILCLAKLLPEVQFFVVGGEDEAIARYTRKTEVKELKNIRFVGFVNNAELPLYLAACDILLMPYQRELKVSGGGNTSGWMSPMKMFEYMATGRLIISSDLPVLREVLNDGNSMLCEPEDVNAWRMAIKRALSDCALRKKLGSQAQRDVKEYEWRKRVRRVLSGIEN